MCRAKVGTVELWEKFKKFLSLFISEPQSYPIVIRLHGGVLADSRYVVCGRVDAPRGVVPSDTRGSDFARVSRFRSFLCVIRVVSDG